MKILSIVGALGANAERRVVDGRAFVTFRVAENETVKKSDGSTEERVTWISCILNGENANLLPYLVRGAKVFVVGSMSTRVYSSKKLRALVAGVDLNVMRLELVGGKPSSVPSRLYDISGVEFPVTAYYKVEGCTLNETLLSRDGRAFLVCDGGWLQGLEVSDSGSEDEDASDSASEDEEEAFDPAGVF